MLAASAAPAANAVSVRPGGLLRWAGATAESCLLDGRRFAPVDGDCYFPVDLMTPAGELELGRWTVEGLEVRRVRVIASPYPVQHITIEDEGKVALSPADLARVRRENARIGRLWSRDTPRRFTLPLDAPLADLSEDANFGVRRFFNQQPRSPHSGADYEAAPGTPVVAPAAGTVALAGDFFFSGKSVFLDHGDELITMSFHLSEIGVATGDQVERGQMIGRVGSTGRATGPHLHFGVRWHGARIDPALLMAAPDELPSAGGG